MALYVEGLAIIPVHEAGHIYTARHYKLEIDEPQIHGTLPSVPVKLAGAGVPGLRCLLAGPAAGAILFALASPLAYLGVRDLNAALLLLGMNCLFQFVPRRPMDGYYLFGTGRKIFFNAASTQQ
ncbi:MAG: hypothetical protein ACYCS4_07980 [Acidimicrobiales bacterium]